MVSLRLVRHFKFCVGIDASPVEGRRPSDVVISQKDNTTYLVHEFEDDIIRTGMCPTIEHPFTSRYSSSRSIISCKNVSRVVTFEFRALVAESNNNRVVGKYPSRIL